MTQRDPTTDTTEFWRRWFTTGDHPREKRQKRILRHLPRSPRCKFCGAPFRGVGAPLVRMTLGKSRSNLNSSYCNVCELFAQKYQGGAEVEMGILFADVRGSTALSEQMSPTAFSQLINRFYVEATRVLVMEDGLIDKLAGDSIAAFWGAGYAGPGYVRRTIDAAYRLLDVTGHRDPGGPWIPLGVGVHAGMAFFGAVGSPDGLVDITAVGDEVNLAARLASSAATGEILITEQALQAASVPSAPYPVRQLKLKGFPDAVAVRVISVQPESVVPASM